MTVGYIGLVGLDCVREKKRVGHIGFGLIAIIVHTDLLKVYFDF